MVSNQPSDDFVRRADLVRVIDGDTLRVRVDLGWSTHRIEDVRLAGINTPEVRGPEKAAGKWVAEQVGSWLGEGGLPDLILHSREFSVGKFGRCVCDVWAGGLNLNEWLLDCRFGWPLDQYGSMVCPRRVDDLNLPEGIRQQVREAMA